MITGTGTEADPFVVHSYDELKEKLNINSASDCYITLEENAVIDCNDYGVDWEWSSIRCNCNGHLNLNGGLIKNAIIAENSNMFEVTVYNRSLEISNGRMLNILGDNAKYIIYAIGKGVKLTNVTMSIDGDDLSDSPFYGFVTPSNTSVCFKSRKFRGNSFMFGSPSMCDFYVDIDDINTKYLADADTTWSDCRMRGEIGGNFYVYQNVAPPFPRMSLKSCVFDIDCKTTNMTNLVLTRGVRTNTVVNADKLPDGYTEVNSLNITSEQITSASSLNDKGFPVLEVE